LSILVNKNNGCRDELELESGSEVRFKVMLPADQQQAGPSGAGSQHLGKSVEESEDLFQTGIECIRVRVEK